MLCPCDQFFYLVHIATITILHENFGFNLSL